MALSFNRKVFMFLVLTSTVSVTFAEFKSPSVWRSEFTGLSSGISRLDAEKEIERVRKIKSTYDLWAMDTSATVAYRLDTEMILLVTYKPGSPAPRIIDKDKNSVHLPPKDGSLVGYEVLQLK